VENNGLKSHHESTVQSNLARGRITVLSSLAAANGFVRHVRWAGTFVYGRYVIMGRHMSQSDPSHGGSGPNLGLTYGSFNPREWVRPRFSRFCTAHSCAEHKDRQTHRPRYIPSLSFNDILSIISQNLRSRDSEPICLGIIYDTCTSTPMYKTARKIWNAWLHQFQRYDWRKTLKRVAWPWQRPLGR